MEYRLDMGMWNQVFAVPCALVDRHLKLAGKEQLQVLLWALRNAGQAFSPQGMAQALGLSEEGALEALEYWTDRGLLAENRGQLQPVPQPESTPAPMAVQAVPAPEPPPASPPSPAAQPVAQPAASALPPKKRIVRGDSLQLAARMEESEGVRFLMQEAEGILGRTLSPAMASLLLSITDDYGLPPEVTVMLLQYAREMGKTGTAYIDTVARDWAESEVFSLEAAEKKLQELSIRRQAWDKVCRALNLDKRPPSKKEEALSACWVGEWGFSEEMLAAAYERCTNNTGRFSMAYINRVLESWHAENLRTLAEVEKHEQAQRAARGAPSGRKAGQPQAEKSYDIGQLERMSFFDLPEDL